LLLLHFQMCIPFNKRSIAYHFQTCSLCKIFSLPKPTYFSFATKFPMLRYFFFFYTSTKIPNEFFLYIKVRNRTRDHVTKIQIT
jgi:hypothetical protein